MTLNPNFVVAPSLEQYFVDKTTGLPLSGGKIFFYSDVNRSTLKPIYTISGNPPNYTYVQLPNPCILSSVGTFQDQLNNNVLPYYYPYDADGNLELYYIKVFDQNDVQQFDRSGWPNLVNTNAPTTGSNLKNFIPNGQFWAHNNIPNNGKVTQSLTNVAPGNWYFSRPPASTSTDFVKFFRHGSYVSTPQASPRFLIQVSCTSPNITDAYKVCNVRFQDVNKFASLTQYYTFSFYGQAISSGNFPVVIRIVKNYGSGGTFSPQEIVNITTLNITSANQQFIVPILFGVNTGKIVGLNNDDYVAVEISFPTDRTFEGNFSDFVLATGRLSTVQFPATTSNEFLSESLIYDNPQYDGSNLYLPVISGSNGYIYDNGQIGSIYAKNHLYGYDATNPSLSNETNELFCNGKTYDSSGYSALGIPFSRLQKRLFDPVSNMPICGTGADRTTAIVCESDPSTIFIFNNNYGTTSPVTGFSSSLVSSSSPNGYGFNTFFQQTDTGNFLNISNTVGYFPDINLPNAGTSGFTVNVVENDVSNLTFFSFQVQVLAASFMTPGSYFYFSSLPSFQTYYIWFVIDGVGADPAPSPGWIGIKVNLLSTYTLRDVSIIVSKALAGCQNYSVQFPSGNSIVGGQSLTYSVTDDVNIFYIWYTVDGFGSPPNAPDQYLLNVDIASSDGSIEIAQETMMAMNNATFAVPDFRGIFLRGHGNQPILPDLDSDLRFGNTPFMYGSDADSTYQTSANLSHFHGIKLYEQTIGPYPGIPSQTIQNFAEAEVKTETSGTYESRPNNINVYWVMRY